MSMEIDSNKCTGCGICADTCPRKAIRMHDNLAVIDRSLCTGCGNCISVCPTGAIRQLTAARVDPIKGSERIYGYGRGFGFRGSSPPWPYIGRGRGGMARCWYPGLWGAANYRPGPTRDEELGFLKGQADIMKSHLEDVERRIRELEKKE